MITIVILAVALGLPITLAVVGWAARTHAGNRPPSPRLLQRAIVGHLLFFGLVYVTLLAWAIGTAQARESAAPTSSVPEEVLPRARGLSVGDGLALIGVALATGLSVLGAGYAVAVVGSAALGAIAEKPELFGRTLVFIGLAEGLAIYGLIMSILMLGRLG
jgi:V/A-type H+-transporting ATPase subunit K